MIYNIVFLLSVGVVLGYHLQESPQDLKIYFRDIETQVKALQDHTLRVIKTNEEPLDNNITVVKKNVLDSMNEAAKSYWAVIRTWEEDANKNGKDISSCLEIGNDQLYELNTSLVNSLFQSYDHYYNIGLQLLNYSLIEADGVLAELGLFNDLVSRCNNDDDATSLMKDITSFYARAKRSLTDAETKINNYVLKYLPTILSWFKFDTNSYVAKYTNFLNDIENCINNM